MKKKIINNHQQGAALVIVMAFLAAGLIVGISGMNASYIDERLAGNYRAVTIAQIAAEHGGAVRIEEDGFNSSGNSKLCLSLAANFEIDEVNECDGAQGCVIKSHGNFDKSYDYVGCIYEGVDAEFIVGKVKNTAGDILATRSLIVGKEPDGVTTGPDDFPTNLSSSLVCVGSNCTSEPSDYFLGEASLPSNFNCNGSGCRQNADDSDSYVQESELDAWREFASSLSGIKKESGSLSQGTREEPNIIEITGGVSSSGNTNTSGIIVVRDGGVLTASGTGSHEGLIIVEEGGEVDLGKNFSLYGSVVALDGLDNISDSGSTPNGGARYNQAALTGLPKGSDGYVWLSP